MKELIQIQQKLKAPKNQRNNFGGFNYRSAEDILEAVKPIAHGLECIILLRDELIHAGDRYYIKAIASITNKEGNTIEISAFAREEEKKKGMDSSQVTGAASSYARKYAMSGLFAIDDTKESDFTNNGQGAEDEGLEAMYVGRIDECKTLDQIKKTYAQLKGKVPTRHLKEFNSLVSKKKKELEEANENTLS